MPLKSPFVPQKVLYQGFAATAGFLVSPVVSPHHRFHLGLLNQLLKCRKVSFPHVLWGSLGIKAVAQPLRAGMHCKMLGTCRSFQVLPLSLQSFHKGFAQFPCEVRVFPIGLMPPAPSGIPENIDIRGPEGQPLIDVAVSLAAMGIVLGAPFHCNGIPHQPHQFPVKSCRHGNCLGKAGGSPCPGYPVEGFVPPIISRHPSRGMAGES